jgi:HEAT repeat protein
MGEARARHAAALAKLAAPGGGPWLETIKELSVSDDDLAMIALLDAGRALAEPERRAAVAREVGMLGNVRAWESMIEWLADPDARVRREAARSLAKVDREKAFEPLVDRLEEEPDPGAREALFKALGVGDAGGTRTIEQEKPERFEAVVVALGLSGDAAVLPHLIKLARSGDPAAARRAAEALGRCPSPASFEALVALLEDGRAPGMQAPRALAELGDPKAVAPLRRALGAAHPSVRRGACEALGRLKAADAAGDLRKRLEDEDAGVRVEAGRALFRLGDDSGVPVMIGVLEDRWECADARRALVEIAGTDQGDAAAWSAWWAAKRK